MANSGSVFPPGLVIYQIYPRSFQDTDDDGIGDLEGIISRLDYFSWLGVNAIWINPFYRSPMADFGYDVSDHKSVDKLFGDIDTFERLVSEAHKRGLKIIIDLVVNHTSDQHPWFEEARKAVDSTRHDWYIWNKGGEPGAAPNNWLGVFGGSAWEWNEATKEYYLHSFSVYQPDLNWNNPEVRAAVKDIMKFWLDKGVDGFRLDAVYWYAKDDKFRDDPPNLQFQSGKDNYYDSLNHKYSRDQAKLGDYLKELSSFIEQYPGRFMITEAYVEPPTDEGGYLKFYNEMDARVGAPFNFTAMDIPWNATSFKRFIDIFQAGLQPIDTPIYVFGNHDRPRLASHFDPENGRAVALLQLTLPGIAIIYYADELGLTDVSIPPSAIKDTVSTDGKGKVVSRDGSRTPMQWEDGLNAGFSAAPPWLPIGDYKHINVESEKKDPNSLLNWYKQLLALRHHSEVLKHGIYAPLILEHPDLFGYLRIHDKEIWAVVINFSPDKEVPYSIDKEEILLSTAGSTHKNILKPGEGRLLKL